MRKISDIFILIIIVRSPGVFPYEITLRGLSLLSADRFQHYDSSAEIVSKIIGFSGKNFHLSKKERNYISDILI